MSGPGKPLVEVVLVEPRIPPNTGNVIRLCANAGARLHLVEPLGFPIDHAKMRRAGLDYHEFATLLVHDDWLSYLTQTGRARRFALSTRGRLRPSDARFVAGDHLVFGSETRGLSADVLSGFTADARLRLPMRPGNRSLNLSNAVAITVYEAWRQLGFEGAGD